MGHAFSHFSWGTLLDWYKKNGRHTLPWRNYTKFPKKDIAYHVWVSEIFLQQTQVSRVIGYYERVMERFPHVDILASTDYETFFPYYQGLGYYSRARNMLKAAKIIKDEYAGIFPRDMSALKKLPGIGDYTARAILSFAYEECLLAWDTNLEKVFSRYFYGDRTKRLDEREKGEIESSLKIYSYEYGVSSRDINSALMDFAAIVDLSNREAIDWESYPLKESRFYRERGIHEVIEKKKNQTFPTPDASIIVTLHEDHKVYFSENTEVYTAFILPPSLTRDTRKYVQEYFRNKYSLELSVRPPHKKWISEDGSPYIAVNAQVQTGKHDFKGYNRTQIQSCNELS